MAKRSKRKHRAGPPPGITVGEEATVEYEVEPTPFNYAEMEKRKAAFTRPVPQPYFVGDDRILYVQTMAGNVPIVRYDDL